MGAVDHSPFKLTHPITAGVHERHYFLSGREYRYDLKRALRQARTNTKPAVVVRQKAEWTYLVEPKSSASVAAGAESAPFGGIL